MVHLNGPNSESMEAETIEDDDEVGENPSSSQSVKRRKLQPTLDSFVKLEKTPIQSIVAELVSKDGLTFRQIEGSRWIQKLLKQSGYDPPKTHNTVKKYTMDEADIVRSKIVEMFIKLKEQGKKFTTSVDEQTTSANFRILNVQIYSEIGSFNLGMVRINITCNADTMVAVSC